MKYAFQNIHYPVNGDGWIPYLEVKEGLGKEDVGSKIVL